MYREHLVKVFPERLHLLLSLVVTLFNQCGFAGFDLAQFFRERCHLLLTATENFVKVFSERLHLLLSLVMALFNLLDVANLGHNLVQLR